MWEEYAKKAIEEAVAWYTIGIDASSGKDLGGLNWATGALIEFRTEKFIVTCKHAFDRNLPDEKFSFLKRADEPMQYVQDKESFSKHSLKGVPKSYAQPLTILGRFYSDDSDDVLIIRLDKADSRIDGLKFCKLREDKKSPQEGTQIFLTGFSSEFVRFDPHEKSFGILPFFEASKVVDAKSEMGGYERERHFLIDYPIDEHSVEPKGFSGAGIWARDVSEKGSIWSPNLYLVGIQQSYFRESKVLKATRLERILNLLEHSIRFDRKE